MGVNRWLDRRAERRDERERARQERGYVVAGVYIGNRTPRTRREVEPMDVAPAVPSLRAGDLPPPDYDG